ncbi:SH3 domain-containing YSC84-like protein 1 [Smittium culicis]|uniref:SH3 domain-containing YSC84-like protein 1 n=1 Tax=Smittium culicis TaxID=133412 RepID=A0A1R1X2S4_9FUNG|nr:SH3 domain-containing YSC84-like protein 1 [Smittium culicis]
MIIPADILDKCKGIAILTVMKGGIIMTGSAGSGLVVAKLPSGKWSAPSAIGTAGIGFGSQIGAEITDFVMILNTDSAVEAFSHGGNLTLGASIGIAAGPVGWSAEAGGAVVDTAPVFSYSKSKGLFAGISLEGSVIIERKGTNERFYGVKVSAAELLSGKIDPPPKAQRLYDAIEMRNTRSKNTAEISSKLDILNNAKSHSDAMKSRSNDHAKAQIEHDTPMKINSYGKKNGEALFDFVGESESDLSFKKGDRIQITFSTDSQLDWWKGLCNGKSGNVR